MVGRFETVFTDTRSDGAEARPQVALSRSFLSPVLHLAEESGRENCVGALDVGELRGQERALNLKSSILVDSSHSRLLIRTDNEVFVAVPCDLKRIVRILGIDPLAEEFRSSGSASYEGDGSEQVDRYATKDQRFH